MANRLTGLNVEFVSLVDRAAVRDPQNPTEPQRFLVWKSETVTAGDPTTPEPQGGPMTTEELQAELEKAQQERDAALEAVTKADEARQAAETKASDLEKAAKPAEEPATTEIDKSELPAAVREALEKAETERDELRKAAADATELAKAEREIRVSREFGAKADTYRALPIEADTFGPVLKSISEKLTKDEAAELDRVLKAADEQIASSELFKEHGRGGEPAGESADQSIVAKAEEIRKADASVSEAQALDQALRENPELAASYLASIR